jgi:hypothetical protein
VTGMSPYSPALVTLTPAGTYRLTERLRELDFAGNG